jgi:hypothetical protein
MNAQNLSYHVPSSTNKGQHACLLESVHGYIEPHHMTALVGHHDVSDLGLAYLVNHPVILVANRVCCLQLN